jgi:hypothetical protein
LAKVQHGEKHTCQNILVTSAFSSVDVCTKIIEGGTKESDRQVEGICHILAVESAELFLSKTHKTLTQEQKAAQDSIRIRKLQPSGRVRKVGKFRRHRRLPPSAASSTVFWL